MLWERLGHSRSLKGLGSPAQCPLHHQDPARHWRKERQTHEHYWQLTGTVQNVYCQFFTGLRWPLSCWKPNMYLRVIEAFVLAVCCWGVPGMQFDLPEFDLLVPWATAVLPELIRSLWVNTWLTHVSGKKKVKLIVCKSLFRTTCDSTSSKTFISYSYNSHLYLYTIISFNYRGLDWGHYKLKIHGSSPIWEKHHYTEPLQFWTHQIPKHVIDDVIFWTHQTALLV